MSCLSSRVHRCWSVPVNASVRYTCIAAGVASDEIMSRRLLREADLLVLSVMMASDLPGATGSITNVRRIRRGERLNCHGISRTATGLLGLLSDCLTLSGQNF